MDPNTGIEKSEEHEGLQPQAPYRFNTEELRVLRQCNKESFYQRSLPLSTVLSIGTYYAVKSGYFKSHPRFGPSPKVIIAATVGYFVGKFSYQSKCAEKLMQLPNSPIGEMLRQRRRQSGQQETFADQMSLAWPEIDLASGPSQTWDNERPMSDGIDSYRPLDSPTFGEETILSAPSQSTTYEELRRKNREEYELKRPKPFRGTSADDIVVPSASTPSESDSFSRNKAKNKYGDVWEE